MGSDRGEPVAGGAGERLARVERVLREELAPEHLVVRDESERHRGHAGAAGGGAHYRVTIVSSRFEGRSRLERHRLVYAALGEAFAAEIHALAIRARTPAEWERESRAAD
jgi:BolA protein